MYPSLEAAARAGHLQLARWYRQLPSPADDTEKVVLDVIVARFQFMGGWSPALSKAVGW